ncbi:MAG: serine/threonine-protein kinase [Planctomycetota bacterium]|nr:serine/threonine-protein kinase [Planctomycetota bacterium]
MEARDDRMIPRILEKGLATQEQIDAAVQVRNHLGEMGMRVRSVAEVLFEQGVIEKDQLEDLQREDRRVEGQEQIAGYRLLQKLGEGAMGSVYKARQLSLDREVAIKVLAPQLSEDEQYVQRFFTEAKAVARLNHTNIISGIDVGESGGVRYLVMEYADGMTVASLLNRGGALDEERVLQIALQMARALDHAHRNNLVHRDVKPDNIIITKDGVAKLCDLGLARLEHHEGDEPARMGTAAYISPEQARGGDNVTERTDLYSLGCTLFHMLTGHEPFQGDDAGAVLAQHLTEPAPSVRSIDPTISERVDLLVQTLMAKDPADRISSAKDLVGNLEAALRDVRSARGATVAASTAVSAAPKAQAAKPAPEKKAPGMQAPVRRRKRRRM